MSAASGEGVVPREEPPLPPPVPEGQAIPLGVQPIRWYHHTRAALVILLLVILVGSFLYPLVVTGVAAILAPGTASGQSWAGYNQTPPTNATNNSTATTTVSASPMTSVAVVPAASTLALASNAESRWRPARDRPADPAGAGAGAGSSPPWEEAGLSRSER